MSLELTTATSAQLSGIRQSLRIDTLQEIFPFGLYQFYLGVIGIRGAGSGNNHYGPVLNCAPAQNFAFLSMPAGNTPAEYKITTVLNADKLTNLEDAGTEAALNLNNNSLTQQAIDKLFTDLPPTTKTATINVAGNPGFATCDPTIATNKGYIVVTL